MDETLIYDVRMTTHKSVLGNSRLLEITKEVTVFEFVRQLRAIFENQSLFDNDSNKGTFLFFKDCQVMDASQAHLYGKEPLLDYMGAVYSKISPPKEGEDILRKPFQGAVGFSLGHFTKEELNVFNRNLLFLGEPISSLKIEVTPEDIKLIREERNARLHRLGAAEAEQSERKKQYDHGVNLWVEILMKGSNTQNFMNLLTSYFQAYETCLPTSPNGENNPRRDIIQGFTQALQDKLLEKIT